jgi:hypothetical protein
MSAELFENVSLEIGFFRVLEGGTTISIASKRGLVLEVYWVTVSG